MAGLQVIVLLRPRVWVAMIVAIMVVMAFLVVAHFATLDPLHAQIERQRLNRPATPEVGPRGRGIRQGSRFSPLRAQKQQGVESSAEAGVIGGGGVARQSAPLGAKHKLSALDFDRLGAKASGAGAAIRGKAHYPPRVENPAEKIQRCLLRFRRRGKGHMTG